jgi:peptidoglycan biosynthesis protein MviN/MurJ (putative lipid II flippase)
MSGRVCYGTGRSRIRTNRNVRTAVKLLLALLVLGPAMGLFDAESTDEHRFDLLVAISAIVILAVVLYFERRKNPEEFKRVMGFNAAAAFKAPIAAAIVFFIVGPLSVYWLLEGHFSMHGDNQQMLGVALGVAGLIGYVCWYKSK